MGTSDWASDFQKMHLDITPEPALSESDSVPQRPSHITRESAWHEDFTAAEKSQDASLDDMHGYGPPRLGYSIHGGFGPLSPGAMPFLERGEVGPAMTQDAVDFDAIFSSLESDLQLNRQNSQSSANFEVQDGRKSAALDGSNKETAPEDVKDKGKQAPSSVVSNDQTANVLDEGYTHLSDPFFHDPHATASVELGEGQSDQTQNNTNSDDADALAETATQLLENVKDDTSSKFQQSNFLTLMRQLRDREVHVEGDKLVQVSVGS